MSEEASSKSNLLHRVLNFEEQFKHVSDQNVFPVLAKYDQYIEFDIQNKTYDNHPIQVLEKGHITGALDSSRLFNHIQKYI